MKKTALKIISLVITIAIVLSLIPAAFAAVDPITITVTFDKTEVNINEPITATYSISGGNGNYTGITLQWTEKVSGSGVDRGFQYPSKSQGTTSFTPTIGEAVQLYFSVYDTDGQSTIQMEEEDINLVNGFRSKVWK